LAARMEQMAMPGSILIPHTTLKLVEDYVVIKPLGLRPVKGIGRAIEVYEVTGASPVRSRFHAARLRGLTRFVGRQRELDQLKLAADEARTGRDQVVAVVGELRDRLFPDGEYTFKRALTHEVAYGSLLSERRWALHASVVDAIEASYPERLTEQVERLALHAFQAELWDKAVGYLGRAGLKAGDHSAHREAVSAFKKAPIAFRHLHRSDTLQQAIDIRALHQNL
jgi:hypothetical protein